MPDEIIANNWGAGWQPSLSDVGNLQDTHALLRMDNLTLDDVGALRSSTGYRIEAPYQFDDIIGIFSTTLPNLGVTRYVFDASGNLYRFSPNVAYIGVFPSQNPASTTVVTNAIGNRAAFCAILGHTFIIIGTTQLKDRGDVTKTLGIAAPSAPTVSYVVPTHIDLISGSTNWTSVDTATFNNAADPIVFTPGTSSNRGIIQDVYAAPIDTTALPGGEADTDIFLFNFQIDDISKLSFVLLEFYHENPTGAATTHKYWKEWDFNLDVLTNTPGYTPSSNSPYLPFAVSSGVMVTVSVQRSAFINYNFDPSKNWTNIAACRVSVGCFSSANIQFGGLKVQGGANSAMNTTNVQYKAVAVRDTGFFLEFSPASPATIAIDNTNSNYGLLVTPAGAVDAQANQYWLFRLDDTTGEYLLANIQSGADGFTPAAFSDGQSSATLIENAASNTNYTLQFYRTALPNNIIDMIWFRDRMIYLTPDSFIPSFTLDPGSYDSRFVYQVSGGSGNAEICLFIVKLDVGNFIVATTKDFYRVTGKFTLTQDINTGAILQDVNIYPLGVSNPAISRAHTEFQGSIVYIAADGPRMLTNFVSNSINDGLDTIFKKEARYGLSPVRFAPNDTAPFAIVSRDKRVYFSMPHYDGYNRVYVCTFETSGYNILQYSRNWRLWTMGDTKENPTVMFVEENGTILVGGNKRATYPVSLSWVSPYNNYLRSIESGNDHTSNALYGAGQGVRQFGQPSFLPIKFKTPFYYGKDPNIRKDALSLKIGVDTNNNPGILIITGYGYDGTINKVQLQFNGFTDGILELDLKANDGFGNSLGPCFAYSFEMGCYTDYFKLTFISLIYESRPAIVRRSIMYATDLDNFGRKRIEAWPFHVDPLTAANIVRAIMRVDGVTLAEQDFTGYSAPTTLTWYNPTAVATIGVSWELEVYSDDSMEFYKFEQPVIAQQMPGKINYVIKPHTNFGKAGPKKIVTWPFVVNGFGNNIRILVTIDGVAQQVQTVSSVRIQTCYWLNNIDTMGVDWQIEVYTDPGAYMEFYGFLEPEVVQVFPVERVIDQIGPFDLEAKGVITGIRIRAYATNATLSYQVYADDVSVYGPTTITMTVNKDMAYFDTFPKGIDPTTCRIVLTSSGIFYRFSVELRVRKTGRDTEEVFIKV